MTEIFHDGMRLVPSRESARRFNITNDYIGRLCKQGKVSGSLISGSWYVNEESLRDFLLKTNREKYERREALREQRAHAYREAQARLLGDAIPAKRAVVAEKKKAPLPPRPLRIHATPRRVPKTFTLFAQRGLAVMFAVVIVIGGLRFSDASVFQIAREVLPAAAVLAGRSDLATRGAQSALADFFGIESANESYWIWYEPTGEVIDQPTYSPGLAERPSVVERIVNAVTPSSISEALIDARIAALESRLMALISLVPPSNSVAPVYHYYVDNSSGVGGAGFDDIDITNSTYTGGTITGATITGGSVTATAFDGVLPVSNGGTGTSTYATGDILYADSPSTLGRLAQGTNGQVLKVVGGNLVWSQDIAGGGGSGAFATTSDDLAIYVADPTDVVIIGSNATSTTGNILEIAGNTLMRGVLTAYNTITAPIFTATSTTATSTMPRLNITGSLGIGSDYITDISGDGLNVQSGALSLDRTGNWTGTFDGLEGSYYLANSFSTTSASYFISQQNLSGFSTTSADYWKDQRNFFSTTSADYYTSVNNFFSTTSAAYFLSQNQEEAFSTTSADFWQTQRNFFSTTSSDYWKTVNNFFSTTSADFWKTANNFFSTTSNDYWMTERNFFSSTSASYFLAQNQEEAFSTTSATYFLTQNGALGFSTTSANYFVHSSTTVPKLYTANTFTALQTFGNASSSIFSADTLCISNDCRTAWPSGGSGFSTTSADYWKDQRNFFSTTSATYFSSVGLAFSTTSSDYWASERNFFSTTSANYFLSQNQGAAFSSTSANYFIHSSSTVPKLYTSNVWTGGNIFANATTTYATTTHLFVTDTFAGAGLSSCNASGDKLVYNANTKQFECGSDAGAGGGITSLRAQYSTSQTGSAQVFATSSDTNLQLTITSSGDTHTFTPVWSGVLAVSRGGTGLSSAPTYGQVLVGDGLGGYVLSATSSLGLSSFSTTSADYWQTQRNFFSTTSAQYFAHSSSTIPKTYSANTFTALQNFANASSTLFSASYASTTNLFANTASTSNLTISALQNGLLKVNASGVVSLAIAGTDYANFAYPFPNNATSTLLSFNGGLTAYASSTIGNGTQTGGLTISGGATTTGNQYVSGGLGIGIANTSAGTLRTSGNATIGGDLTVSGSAPEIIIDTTSSNFPKLQFAESATTRWSLEYSVSNDNFEFYSVPLGAVALVIDDSTGNVGIGTSSPYSRLTTWGSGGLFQAVNNSSTTIFSVGQGGATTTRFALTGVPSALLATDASGNVYATTTLGGNYVNSAINSYIHSSTTIPKTYTANSFSALQTFTNASSSLFSSTYASSTNLFAGAFTLGSLNGPLHANNGVVSATSSVLAIYGGTGQTSYSVGDILYADSTGSLAKLPIGGTGTVLKVQGGLPSWQTDLTSGGGGGSSAWSTTTDSLAIYPSDTTDVLIVGASATATTNSILEVFGRSYFSNNVGIGTTSAGARLSVEGSSLLGNSATAGFFTATTSTASVFPYASTTALSATTLCLDTDCRTAWPTGIAYPFGLTGNATSTLTQFNGGLTAYASSTIGNGAQAGGLTISGGATTTGNAYFGGAVNIGSGGRLSMDGSDFVVANSNFANLEFWSGGAQQFTIGPSGNVFLTGGGTLTLNTSLNGPLQAINGEVSATSTISVAYGGTGLSTAPTYGQLLLGNASGGYTLTSTSSLGLISSAIQSIGAAGQLQTGSAQTFATSTLSFNGLTSGMTIVSSGNTHTFTPTLTGTLNNSGLTNSTISGIALGGTLGALTATNNTLTFSGSYDGSTARTVGLNLANANTWTALQTFANASSTLFSSSYASTTNLFANTASTSNLTISALQNGLLKVNSSGVVSLAVAGTDYQTFAYPFSLSGNATSTLTQFNGGLTAYASSTIGNGTQTGGLTISGGATTTGNAYFAGSVSTAMIRDGSNVSAVDVANRRLLSTGTVNAVDFSSASAIRLSQYTTNGFLTATGGNGTLTVDTTLSTSGGNLGVGTSSPYAKLSVAGEIVGANFTATTTAVNTFPTLLSTNATTTNLGITGVLSGLLATRADGTVYATTSISSSLLNTSGDWTGTFDGQEGSYYLANSFSTTSANHWSSLGLGFSTTSSDYWMTQRNFFSTTSANYWKSVNDFFSTTSAIYFTHSSTTIPKTYTTNTFTALQNFANASSTLFSASYASTTNLFANTASTSNLTISALQNGLLKVNASGVVSLAVAGTDYQNFAYPFPSNATSTTLTFNGGLYATASSTFATTINFPGGIWDSSGNLGIGMTNPSRKLDVTGTGRISSALQIGTGGSYEATLHVNMQDVPGVPQSDSLLVLEHNSQNVALNLFANSDYDTAIYFGSNADNDSGRIIYDNGTNALSVGANNNTDQLVLSSNGRVGIGTASPSSRLTVVGEVTAANFTATTSALNTLPTLLSTNASTTNLGITGLPSALLATDANGRVYATTSISSGLLNTSGDWTGTFDGQEGSYYLANSFSTTSAMYFTHSSTTIAKTYTTNTFTALQSFLNASSTLFSSSYASTTNLFAFNASTSGLIISSVSNALLKTNANGQVAAAVLGTDYQNFAYPFSLTSNATSTLTQFNGGLTAFASSTIGNGTQAGGLTISGGATTTGYLKVLSTATSSFAGPLAITSSGTSTFANGIQLSAGCFRDAIGNCLGNQDLSIYVDGAGNGSTNRVAYWSDNNTLTSDADFSFDGTTVTARDLLIQHTAPILSLNDSDTTGTDFRLDVADGSAIFKADVSAALSSEFFAWTTNNDEKMRLTEAGRLGVGSTSPAARLTVNSVAGDAFSLWVGSTTNPWLTVANTGFGTTTLRGLNINGQATSTSNVGFNLSAGCYAINGTCISAGGSSFAYPFSLTGNATSTLTQFNGGLTAYASSTIGDGTAAGGLTISGGATTTGDLRVGGNFGAAGLIEAGSLISAPSAIFSTGIESAIGGFSSLFAGTASTTVASAYDALYVGRTATTTIRGDNATSSIAGALTTSGSLGIGTDTPSGKFSVGSAPGQNAYFFYDNEDVGDTTDGQTLSIYRRAAEADDHIRFSIDQFRNGYIDSTVPNLIISAGSGGTLSLAHNAGGVAMIAHGGNDLYFGSGWMGSGRNPSFYQYGYITEVSSAKYVRTQVSDASNRYELSREDAGIEGFEIKMPTLITGGNVGIGTTTPWAKVSIQGNPNDGTVNTTLFAVSSTTNAATTTLFSISNTGSTTAANGFNITAGCYAINGTCIGGGGGSSNWSDLGTFLSPLTSTDGIIVAASSTIGNGSQAGGLTISGGATTTGNLNVRGGLVRVGSDSYAEILGMSEGVSGFDLFADASTAWLYLNDAGNRAINLTTVGNSYLNTSGNFGIGTSSPYAKLSIQQSATSSPAIAISDATGASGFQLRVGTTSLNNIFMGTDAGGQFTTTGGGNNALGSLALYSNVSGAYNNALGWQSLYANTSGSGNNALGDFALTDNTEGDYNQAIGSSALANNTTGDENVALGLQSMVTNTTGSWNAALGSQTLYANTRGSYNSGVGYGALAFNTTGSYNVGIGYWTGATHTIGTSTTLIGAFANTASNNLSTSTAIGAGAIVGCSNCLVLGGTSANAVNVGIGTTTPASLLSLAGTSGIFASTTATSTFFGGGINLVTSSGNTGCFAVNGTCIGGGGSLTGTQGQVTYFSGANTAVGTSTLFINPNRSVGVGTTSAMYSGAFSTLVDSKLAVDFSNADTSGTRVGLHVTGLQSVDKTGTNIGIQVDPSFDGTSGSGLSSLLGARFAPANLSTGNVVEIVGVMSRPTNDAGTADYLYGLTSSPTNYSGTVGYLYGGHINPYNNGGDTTNMYGLSVTPGIDGGTIGSLTSLEIAPFIDSGTIGSYYGIRIAGVTSQNDNYGIYQESATSRNYFAGNVGIGTTTPQHKLSITDAAAPQLSLSAGAGIAQWAFRNAGGDLFFSTTTVAGTATTSTAALTVSGSGFGTTTVRGLNIAGQATSTSNVGFNLAAGCYAINGTCITGGGGASLTGTQGQVAYFSGANTAVGTSTLFISSSEKVGIGTTTPWGKLSVSNYNGTTTPLFVVASSTGSGATSTAFFIDPYGNVGVGTTSMVGSFAGFGLIDKLKVDMSGMNAFQDTGLTVTGSRTTGGTFTSMRGILSTPTYTGSGSGTNGLTQLSGGIFAPSSNGGGEVASMIGLSAAPSSASGTSTTITGIFAQPQIAAGTTTQMIGVHSAPSPGSFAFSSIGSMYSFYADPSPLTVGAIIGNYYGIYLDTPPAAQTVITGNRYGVYQSDALATNILDGVRTGIGTTSPFAKLSVHAAASNTNTTLFAIASSTNAATTTLFSISNTGSTTAANGFNITAGCYAINGTCITGGGGGGSSNWTDNGAFLSPLTGTDGILVAASSTIGAGAQATGLTINGGATTTGSFYVASNVGIGTMSPSERLQIFNSSTARMLIGDSSRILQAGVDGDVGAHFGKRGSNGISFADAGDLIPIAIDSAGVTTFPNNNSALGRDNIRWGALFVDGLTVSGGNVGIGTTSPSSLFSLAGTSGIFASTTATSTFFGGGINLVTSSGNTGCFAINGTCITGGGGGSLTGTTGQVAYFSGTNTAVGTSSLFIATNGNVGVGTTTPWALLSINPNNIGNVPAFAIGSSTANMFSVTRSGVGSIFNFGMSSTSTVPDNTRYAWTIATSSTASPLFKIDTTAGAESVALGALGSDVYIGDVGSPSNLVFEENSVIKGSGSGKSLTFGANNDLINFGVNVGIGSSTPWAKLAIIGNHGVPQLWIATTTANGSGQHPLFTVQATTTGDLNYARVGIGTTSVWGGAGLRDQLTVDGRIYSTWTYISCDAPASGQVIATQIGATDTGNICSGNFVYDANTDGAVSFLSSSYPYFLRLSSGITTSHANNEAGSIRTLLPIASASTSPVMEARVRTPHTGVSSSTKMVGFTSMPFGSTTPGVAPANGAYFAASTTKNWIAVVRKGNTETYVDTQIATSTTFARLRVEMSSTTAHFLINGNVVAQISPAGGLPSAAVSPIVMVAKSNATAGQITVPASTPVNSIDIASIRVWVDDPVGGNPQTTFEDQPLDQISGADVAEAYIADDVTKMLEGSIVSNATSTEAHIARSSGRYDRQIMGVVATSPRIVLGEEDGTTIRVGMVGRVPTIVSLENGVIKKGDAVTSSSLKGVGMKARRPGAIVGKTLADFDPLNGKGFCDAELKQELSDIGVAVTSDGCYGRVLVVLDSDFDMGIGEIVQDALENITGYAMAMDELANTAFEKGAELTRFVVGNIVAKIAIIEKLFVKETHTQTLCIADGNGSETCITKAQLDALLAGAAVPAAPQPEPEPEPEPQPDGNASSTPPVDGNASSTPPVADGGSGTEESSETPEETPPAEEVPEEAPVEDSEPTPESAPEEPQGETASAPADAS